MKTYKSYIQTFIFILLGVLMFSACEKDDEAFERTRLFRPVLSGEGLTSERNTIFVNLGAFKEATHYTVEVSRDTFQTIDYTIETDTSYVVIDEDLIGEELLWNTIYQIRAKAHADDPEYDSEIADLGNVRTQRFPTILNLPEKHDVVDTAARVSWTTAGAPVTGVRVFAGDDFELEEPLMNEFEVSQEDRDAEEITITGLDPETEYQIAIYSEEELRGWAAYTTRQALPTGDNVIDIRESDEPEVLYDMLADGDYEEGSIILLRPGMTYEFPNGPTLEKSVEIRSGYDFIPEMATIEYTGTHKGFNIGETTVDYVVFRDIAIRGPYEGSFLFYLNTSGTLGEVRYENCKIGPLRGGMRINSGTGTLEEFTINNSVVDSINDFNFFYVQGADWTIGDVNIQNSTFSKVGANFIRTNNVNDTRSIVIENSTFYEVTENGRNIFEWGQDGVNVTDGIVLRNNIWGRGWNKAGEEDYGIKGYNRLENTNFTVDNNWGTSDLEIYSGEIAGFPSSVYNGDSHDLWVDPDNLDFNFRDSSFGGRRNAGDPQWRDQL